MSIERFATTRITWTNGVCEIAVNGIVSEEIKKMNERFQAKIEAKNNELQAAKNHRNKLLENNLAIYRASESRPVSWLSRARESVVMAWCKLYGLGEHFGLWEYEGK